MLLTSSRFDRPAVLLELVLVLLLRRRLQLDVDAVFTRRGALLWPLDQRGCRCLSSCFRSRLCRTPFLMLFQYGCIHVSGTKFLLLCRRYATSTLLETIVIDIDWN